MIKRYNDYITGTEEAEDGYYVTFEDHCQVLAEAQAQIDALEQRLTRIEGRAKPWITTGQPWPS